MRPRWIRHSRARLAEPDPAADVEGSDTVAKVMILAALVFGGQVSCRGITGVTGQDMAEAASAGGRIRHVATLGFSGPDGTGTVAARVQPQTVPADDLLAGIDGVTNAVVCQEPGRGSDDHRAGRRAGPGGPGRAQRHHRGRQVAGAEPVTSIEAGDTGVSGLEAARTLVAVRAMAGISFRARPEHQPGRGACLPA